MKILTILLLLACINSFSQNTVMEKVPVTISAETGGRYIFRSEHADSISVSGISFMLDYAWQLSGFGLKKPVYLSVPIGYAMHPAGDGTKGMNILYYGWTVKHNLKKEGKIIPFVGYSLLLSRMYMDGIKGSVMGHQTKFDTGVDFATKGKIKPYVKLEYSYTSFPALYTNDKTKLHALEIKIGLRLAR